jgi:hypothetical protein
MSSLEHIQIVTPKGILDLDYCVYSDGRVELLSKEILEEDDMHATTE